MLTIIKNKVKLNSKNIFGWKTPKKIVVFSVDDYGNVRVDSKQAREKMNRSGLKIQGRFDAFDSLENCEDLEMLFETLSSVKDKNGRHAVFTSFAVPCNIDFEKMAEEDYLQYQYELLPQTYKKLAANQTCAYEGAWELWKEGMAKGLLVPQFHGREHLNLKVFEEKLVKRDHEIMNALKNRSYTSISDSGYPTISITAAFDFWRFEENSGFEFIIKDGLDAFEKVYGLKAVHFNPPGGKEHPVIHRALFNAGIKYIDTPLLKREHQGEGKYRKMFNFTGKRNKDGQLFIVRNVVFEPTEKRNYDWVSFTLKQIEAAFRWNRPVVISSHRVNFSGHIEPAVREKGLKELKRLLKEIVKRWPDVEFMTSVELGDLIRNSRKINKSKY